MFGSGAAVVLRIVLTVVAAKLLELSFLQVIGGCLLLWIGYQLLTGGEEGEGESKGTGSMVAAIRTILIADLVMSLDNVIAVAAAANSAPVAMRTPLLVVGLGLSIPLIIFGSSLLLKLMQRFPLIITLGAALLGFVAGQMAVSDQAIAGWFEAYLPGLEIPIALACALGVVLVGQALAARPATARRTYGLARAEILAALVNGTVLIALFVVVLIIENTSQYFRRKLS